MEVRIVAAEEEHVRELGKCLRADDAAEITCFDKQPHKMLWRGYRNSLMTKAAIVEGAVAAMWGIGGTPLGSIGNPWLMTSHACELVSPLRFVRIYQSEVHKMLSIFPVLVNFVAANYTKSIRVLENVGFIVDKPQQLGPHNVMFRKFTMER